MPRLPVYLDIDVSDAQELIKALRAAHSPENFSTIMRRAITRTGNHVKTIVAKDASKHYNITQRRIKQDIGNPQMGASAGSLGNLGAAYRSRERGSPSAAISKRAAASVAGRG